MVWALVVLGRAASPDRVSIRWNITPTNQAIEVIGVAPQELASLQKAAWSVEQWQKLLSVYAEQGALTSDLWLPPMAGSYEIAAETIRFQPRFRMEPGILFRTVFDPSKLPSGSAAKSVSSTFQLPRTATQRTTQITTIYPSAAEVPENLLKFYLLFSAPMSRGHIYEHIRLQDDSGKTVELPFLEINEELWDPSMTRLTLFLDPGRIKRGVKPLEEVGPALQAGHSYTLSIADTWLDADGNPLKTGAQKKFKVTPPDRQPIDPDKWQIRSPQARSSQVLMVEFPKPMDHALARRMIRVVDSSQRFVGGRIGLAGNEREWHFTPDRDWSAGKHFLLVEAKIEDLAGNNIGKAFEVDLFEGVDQHLTNSVMRLPFEIR